MGPEGGAAASVQAHSVGSTVVGSLQIVAHGHIFTTWGTGKAALAASKPKPLGAEGINMPAHF